MRENNISKISFNFQYLCNGIDLYTDYKLLQKHVNYTEFKLLTPVDTFV